MPTVRETLNNLAAQGVPTDRLAERIKEFGFTPEDMDTDLEVAKARRVKPAPPKPTLPPDFAKRMNPLETWFKPPAPAPPADLSVEADAERSGSEERQALADTMVPAVKASGVEVETPLALPSRVRGLVPGVAKAMLGDTDVSRAAEAAGRLSGLATPLHSAGVLGNVALAKAGAPSWARVPETEEMTAARQAVESVGSAPHLIQDPDAALKSQQAAMEASKAERQAKQLNSDAGFAANASTYARNFGSSLWNLGASLADLANKVGGVTVVPKGQTGYESGKALGKELGETMPGQTMDLARGLLEGEANSLAVDPFGTWLMVIDPMLRGTAALASVHPGLAPKVAAVRNGYRGLVTDAIDKSFSAVLPDAVREFGADAVAQFKRTLANGVIQADPRWTGMLSDIVNGTEDAASALKNWVEQGARQTERGAVQTVDPGLRATRVSVVPRGDVAAGMRASREAAGLEREAGRVSGAADAGAQAAEAARDVAGDVRAAQAAAAKVMRTVPREATRYDELEVQNRLGEMGARQRVDPADKILAMREAQSRRLRERQAASPGRISEAAIEAAQRAGQIDATTAADMSRQAAGVQKRVAGVFERRAAEAKAEAADAGALPPTSGEEVFVPADRTGPGKLTARSEASPVPGQQQTLAEMFPEARPEVIADIEQAAYTAGRAQKAAVEGMGALDPERVPLNMDIASKSGLEREASWVEAGKRAAEDLIGRNVDAPATILAEQLIQLADPAKLSPADLNRVKSNAPKVAQWLLDEVEYRNQLRRLEPEYGAIRRPTPEVTQMGVDPQTGRITEMPRVARNMELRRQAGTIPEQGAPRRAQQELFERMGRRLEPEAPKPTTTTNPIVNEALAASADIARQAGYFPKDLEPGTQVAVKPIPLDATVTPQQFMEVADKNLKRLMPQRIAQRLLEVLDNDSTQLLRSHNVRQALLSEFRKRAEAAGFTDFPGGGKVQATLTTLLSDFAAKLNEAKRVNNYSKNRFFEVENPNGGMLWTRQDFADTIAKADPKAINKARADTMREVASDMADAVQANNTILQLHKEVNRFRMTPDGEPIPDTMGNVNGYAHEVVRRVLGEGEARPMMMPYEGKVVADALIPNAADIAAELQQQGLNVTSKQILRLADDLRRYKPAAGENALSVAFGNYVNSVFKGTQAPPDLVNVHMAPSVMDSLRTHFAMMSASDALGSIPALIREVSQQSKKGVVAMNTRALVNNDISNLIVNGFRRADPEMVVNLVRRPLQFRDFLNGDYSKLTSQDVQMYRAFANTNFLDSTALGRDIGKVRLWHAFSEVFSDTARLLETIDAATGGKGGAPMRVLGDLQDTLAKSYQSLGDAPFRLEDMAATYKGLQKTVASLEEGRTLAVPTGTGRVVAIQRVPEGVVLTDVTGPRGIRKGAGGAVSLDSSELSKVFADAANFAQEKVFFDYSKIGSWGKQLRSGHLAALSGIFSWFFKALDIPMIKDGLVTEMMRGPPTYVTDSPKINQMQANAQAAWATRRAFVTAAARSAFTDQRQLNTLSRAFSWTPQVQGAVLAQASSPWYVNVRNIEPLLSTQPTSTLAGAVESAMSYLAYSDLMAQPAALRAMLNYDHGAFKRKAAAVAADPNLAPEQKAQQIEQLRRDDERITFMQAGLRRYASGEQFSVKQALNMIGLGGGPLLGILQRMQAADEGGRPFTVADGVAEFAKQMFGSTVFNAADVAAAGLGELGLDSADRWSTYGKAQARLGVKHGSADADQAGYLRWALHQMLGVGWAEVYFGEGGVESPATATKFAGRAKVYLKAAQKQLDQNLVNPAEDQARLAWMRYRHDPTDENKLDWQKRVNQYRLIKDTVKGEIDDLQGTLDKQYKMVQAIASGSEKSVPLTPAR